MQLNNTHRVAIVEGIMKATYKARFDDLMQRTEEFALKVWDHHKGAFERKLRDKLSTEELNQCFRRGVDFRITMTDEVDGDKERTFMRMPLVEGSKIVNGKVRETVTLLGTRNEGYRNTYFIFTAHDRLATLQAQTTGGVELLEDHPLRKKADDLEAERETLVLDAAVFMSNLKSIVNSTTTDTKLIELLPEAEHYIPKPKKKQQLVALDTIAAVRATINKKGK